MQLEYLEETSFGNWTPMEKKKEKQIHSGWFDQMNLLKRIVFWASDSRSPVDTVLQSSNRALHLAGVVLIYCR